MLDNIKPDIVSITTGGYEYSSDHYEPTIQALEAGCNVLGEKPISNDLRHAAEMVELAAKKHLCYGIDMNHRFTPAARQAKKWQDEGKIGSLLFCNMPLWIGKFMPLDPVYYHIKALNPHSVNIMQYFCGPIKEVSTFAMKAPGRDIYSTQSTAMRFECGAVGHLTSSYDIKRGHPMERCEVAGVNGRLTFEDMWRSGGYTLSRGLSGEGGPRESRIRRTEQIRVLLRHVPRQDTRVCESGGLRMPSRGH